MITGNIVPSEVTELFILTRKSIYLFDKFTKYIRSNQIYNSSMNIPHNSELQQIPCHRYQLNEFVKLIFFASIWITGEYKMFLTTNILNWQRSTLSKLYFSQCLQFSGKVLVACLSISNNFLHLNILFLSCIINLLLFFFKDCSNFFLK